MAMQPVVILVHGWNVDNPELTVGRLRDAFEARGYLVEHLLYGYLPFTWQATKVNPFIAARLAKRVLRWQRLGHPVDIVGHSNGCVITRLACTEHDIAPRTVEAINPALYDTLHPAPTAQWVHVWHNSGDVPVVVGKWLGWLPWSERYRPWGDMGRDGYRGKARNILNLNTGLDFQMPALGHSAVFKGEALPFYQDTIADACAQQWHHKPEVDHG